MRITEVVPLHLERFLFVHVHTDSNLTGLGEAGAWGHIEATHAAITTFGRYLTGQDPFLIERHANVMRRFSHFHGAAIAAALSAIDIALYDLKGQALGVPIYELLGGRVRDRVRVYGHVKAATPEAMVARCQTLAAKGFTAIGHLNPMLDEDRRVPYFKPHARKLHDALSVVQQVREAVGDDVDLCLEIHRRLSLAEALVLAREVAPYRPLFLEDPIPPDNPDAMAELTRRSPVAIATGERLVSPFAFEQLFSRAGLHYARVSLCLCGGLSAAKKIAAQAEAHQLELVPHNPLSPVSLAACLHLAASSPNVALQEYPSLIQADGSLTLPGGHLVTPLAAPEDGFMPLPTAPGLGVRLRPEASERPPTARTPAMRQHRDGAPLEQ